MGLPDPVKMKVELDALEDAPKEKVNVEVHRVFPVQDELHVKATSDDRRDEFLCEGAPG